MTATLDFEVVDYVIEKNTGEKLEGKVIFEDPKAAEEPFYEAPFKYDRTTQAFTLDMIGGADVEVVMDRELLEELHVALAERREQIAECN